MAPRRATTTLVQDLANLNSSLIGRKLIVTGGPGAGQQRFVVGIANGSTVTVDRPWDIDDPPTRESSFIIRVDDALVGKSTAVNSIGLTFTDNARTTPFTTAGEGLRGRTLQIVGGPGAGQQRLILSNTATTLTLNSEWSIAPTNASVYRIELFDGLAVPGVSVQINDNDLAGIIITETGDGTAVIEGGDGNQPGERDTVKISLTKTPSSPVTVSLSNPDGQLSTSALSLNLNSTAAQTVTIRAAQDTVREGEHTGLLNFSLAGGNANLDVSQTDTFTVTTADRPVFFVGLTQTPAKDEATGLLLHSVTVTIDGVAHDPSRFAVVNNKIVFLQNIPNALADGKFEAVTGSIVVGYTYVNPGFAAAETQPVLARIADDDAPTVLVRESGGSTDVVEGGIRLLTIQHGSSFAVDSLVGRTLTIVSGAGSTQNGNTVVATPTATIISNTSNTITIQHDWTALPDGTSQFTISSPAATNGISVAGVTLGNVGATGVGGRNAYQVFLKAGNTYTFDMGGADSGTGTLKDTYLRLFDSNNSQVAFDDDSGPGLSSRIVWQATGDGTYTLYAGSYVDAYTGTYQLSTSVSGEIPASTSTSASLFIGNAAPGVIGSNGDRDFFRVVLSAGNTYTFDLEGSPTRAGTLSDPYLRLHDSTGVQIRANDDGGTGFNSRLTFTQSTSGVYYLSAGGFNDSRTGTYRLSGSVTPTQLQVVSATVKDMDSDTYDLVLARSAAGFQLQCRFRSRSHEQHDLSREPRLRCRREGGLFERRWHDDRCG